MSRKLLCIDDHVNWGLRCAVLSRAGFVTMATPSDNAVSKLQQITFDAVLMDCDLNNSTVELIDAVIPKETKLLRLERGSAGDKLIAEVEKLFSDSSLAAHG